MVDNDTVASVNKIVSTDDDEDESSVLDGDCSIEDMSAGEQTSLIDDNNIEE